MGLTDNSYLQHVEIDPLAGPLLKSTIAKSSLVSSSHSLLPPEFSNSSQLNASSSANEMAVRIMKTKAVQTQCTAIINSLELLIKALTDAQSVRLEKEKMKKKTMKEKRKANREKKKLAMAELNITTQKMDIGSEMSNNNSMFDGNIIDNNDESMLDSHDDHQPSYDDISGSESEFESETELTSKPQKRKAPDSSKQEVSSIFLPSLSAGVIGEDFSDGSDIEQAKPVKKNRMGQQARRLYAVDFLLPFFFCLLLLLFAMY